MWKFLKYTLAVIAGTFVGLALFFIVGTLVAIGVVMIATSEKKDNKVKDNSVLIIKLDQEIHEKAPNNPLKNFNFMSMSKGNSLGLNDILDNIRQAKQDEKIKCILLNVGYIRASYETVEEIREALIDFKKSGKFIIAYSDYYAQSAYYLCTAANKVYMNPEGILEFRGLSAQLIFLKNTLAKIGIEPEPIRHGKYKGAIEMFVNEKMSNENREQHQVYVNAVWKQVLADIGEARNLNSKQLNKIADSLLVRNGGDAVAYHLIDSLKYYDQIIAQIKDSLKIAKKEKVPAVGLADYIEAKARDENTLKKSQIKIAVVIAQGDIMPGSGDESSIGSEAYGKLLRDLRSDSTVKAVVFRLNTGGGSSLASEVIWREVSLMAREKPVIISMGDYCASGGYYVACPAKMILANPLTLTGSIGVYGILFNAQKLMDKIGVSTDIVKTNTYSDIGTVTRDLTPFEANAIRKEVDNTYKKFIAHVASGRKLRESFVDSIGQGRIWSGDDALRLGLIDKEGGLYESIHQAALAGKLGTNYDVVYYPQEEDFFTELMKGFKTKVQQPKLEEYLGDYTQYVNAFKQMSNQQGVQMRMPFVMKIE